MRRADGDGVDGSVQNYEAEEEPPLLAEHRVDLGHEADDVLDGVVPLALPREALQVVHAEEHGRLMEQPGSSAYVQRIDLRPNRIEAIRIWNKKGRESSRGATDQWAKNSTTANCSREAVRKASKLVALRSTA